METSREASHNYPKIKEMPVVEPEVWEHLREEIKNGGEQYYWNLGANLARTNQEHKETYEEALRDASFPDNPSMTSAAVLLVIRALDLQANRSGSSLPEIPSPIDPLPALREFIPRADGTELGLIETAYSNLVQSNPVIGEIVEYMGVGAPDELLRIKSVAEAKRGAIYAFYGIKSAIIKTE